MFGIVFKLIKIVNSGLFKLAVNLFKKYRAKKKRSKYRNSSYKHRLMQGQNITLYYVEGWLMNLFIISFHLRFPPLHHFPVF